MAGAIVRQTAFQRTTRLEPFNFGRGTRNIKAVVVDAQVEHALLWIGRSNRVIDLHDFLPPGYISSSASFVSDDGKIVGTARTIYDESHSMVWVPRAE